jgi:hypothetical protein
MARQGPRQPFGTRLTDSTMQRYSLAGKLAASGSTKRKAISIPPRLKASIHGHTTSTFSRDIAYSDSPAASRACSFVQYSRPRAIFPSRNV